jgi:hypothetical protein
MNDPMDRAVAGGTLARRERDSEPLVTALGVELFGDGKLGSLVICSVCGTIGDPGDDCGKADGHRLRARR